MKEKRNTWTMILLVLGFAVVAQCEKRMGNIGTGLTPSQCKEERRLAVETCRPFVFGQSATPICCQQVRVSHLECVCVLFTPKMAALIDVNRAVKLFRDCGRKLPRQFKCGALDFP